MTPNHFGGPEGGGLLQASPSVSMGDVPSLCAPAVVVSCQLSQRAPSFPSHAGRSDQSVSASSSEVRLLIRQVSTSMSPCSERPSLITLTCPHPPQEGPAPRDYRFRQRLFKIPDSE